ncbi:hypothetical protein HELRODRAFT_166053 [Helobdella robusta]|uniref:Uncharacterized protein n=1 Tax=Helobdella robusta TaxID=6412 RepID=T1EXN0_HELRO|nr:hypothetical protein HELRODRAFT_166053 [Helobdella robusta]ESN90388.1 hypothetical protein HELRODRAFT_166053 [Helobdella robusta]
MHCQEDVSCGCSRSFAPSLNNLQPVETRQKTIFTKGKIGQTSSMVPSAASQTNSPTTNFNDNLTGAKLEQNDIEQKHLYDNNKMACQTMSEPRTVAIDQSGIEVLKKLKNNEHLSRHQLPQHHKQQQVKHGQETQQHKTFHQQSYNQKQMRFNRYQQQHRHNHPVVTNPQKLFPSQALPRITQHINISQPNQLPPIDPVITQTTTTTTVLGYEKKNNKLLKQECENFGQKPALKLPKIFGQKNKIFSNLTPRAMHVDDVKSTSSVKRYSPDIGNLKSTSASPTNRLKLPPMTSTTSQSLTQSTSQASLLTPARIQAILQNDLLMVDQLKEKHSEIVNSLKYIAEQQKQHQSQMYGNSHQCPHLINVCQNAIPEKNCESSSDTSESSNIEYGAWEQAGGQGTT